MSNIDDGGEGPHCFNGKQWAKIYDNTRRGIFIGTIPFFLKFFPNGNEKWKFTYKFRSNGRD